jgi:hypothetical protein
MRVTTLTSTSKHLNETKSWKARYNETRHLHWAQNIDHPPRPCSAHVKQEKCTENF